MSDDRLYRAHPADLELRGGDGRTVVGVAEPFATARPAIGQTRLPRAGRANRSTPIWVS